MRDQKVETERVFSFGDCLNARTKCFSTMGEAVWEVLMVGLVDDDVYMNKTPRQTGGPLLIAGTRLKSRLSQLHCGEHSNTRPENEA